MKKVLIVFFLLIFTALGLTYFTHKSFASLVNNGFVFSDCDTPISYTIGSIDSRFNLNRDELAQAIKQATNTWSAAENKELFVYSSDKADLIVNLTYDERQELTNQIGSLHDQLQTERETIDPQIAEFDARVKEFKQRVSALNSKIAYWNSRGGAPEGEFDKLYDEQQYLKSEEGNLDILAKKLNQSTNDYNTQIGQLNQTIDTFNSTLKTRPEEGLYDGEKGTITIYFMANQNELVHTLTHEFGHSLGLDHQDSPNSVMYYQTNDQLALTSRDTSALSYACREQTIVDAVGKRATLLGHQLEDRFKEWHWLK